MSRPKKSEQLRPGTRRVLAAKLKATRLSLGVRFCDLDRYMRYSTGRPNFRCAAFASYERQGPPTIYAAVRYRHILSIVAYQWNGGVQLDLEEAIKHSPRRA